MTADIRTAAQRGFKFTNVQWREYQAIPDQGYSHRHWIEHQVNEWVARVTPTREQLVDTLDTVAEPWDGIDLYKGADAILALLAGLAEGEDNGEHE